MSLASDSLYSDSFYDSALEGLGFRLQRVLSSAGRAALSTPSFRWRFDSVVFCAADVMRQGTIVGMAQNFAACLHEARARTSQLFLGIVAFLSATGAHY